MQLNEFIKETLIQIITGANKANESLKDDGALVFPANIVTTDGRIVYAKTDHPMPVPISTIKFDVAVTESTERGKTGGIGVTVASIGIGTKRTEENSTNSVSRVSFEVPVLFPQNKLTR